MGYVPHYILNTGIEGSKESQKESVQRFSLKLKLVVIGEFYRAKSPVLLKLSNGGIGR